MASTSMRSLPCSPESEQAILGACLLRPEILPGVRQIIQSSDFYREAHAKIFEAVCDLQARTDPSTVCEWLRARDLMDKCGGAGYLMELAEFASTSAGWPYHAEIIRDKAKRREIIKACEVGSSGAYGMDASADILAGLKSNLREIESAEQADCLSAADLCAQVYKEMERRYETKNPYVGIKTGLANIDTRAWGMEPSTTIYLIARPSMGKTCLGLNISDYVADHYESVIYYSLESSAKALTRRRLASRSYVPLTKLRKAEMADDEWGAVTEGINTLSGSKKFIIQDAPRLKKIEDLMANATSLAMDRQISLIVIDHIQLLGSRARFASRHQEISHISSELASLAKDLKIPILILCQLARWIEHEKVRRPQLSAMKESGDLEQNADAVWSLYRETVDDEIAWVDCLKGRDTGTWSTKLRFRRGIQRFYDLQDEEEPAPQAEIERGYDG